MPAPPKPAAAAASSAGRALATAGVAGALVLSGCGGPSDDQQVRDAVEGFGQASALKDYQRICDTLISRKLSEQVERVGLPCEVAFRRGLEPVQGLRLKVREIKVQGDGRARVRVLTSAKGQPASNDVIELVKEEDEWRIGSLARPEER